MRRGKADWSPRVEVKVVGHLYVASGIGNPDTVPDIDVHGRIAEVVLVRHVEVAEDVVMN